MNTNMKKELINDVLTGLMVAATFAAVAPADAFAQLTTAVGTTSANVMAPAMTILGYLSYAMGAVLTVTGIAGAKKHSDAPAQNPLGPAIGKLGAGAAFLAAPMAISMIQKTGTLSIGAGTGSAVTVGGF